MSAGLDKAFSIIDLLSDIDFAGRTDRWIMRQIFAKHGIPATEANFERYAAAYLAELPGSLAAGAPRILPGARERLVDVAGRPAYVQGLLTGNLRSGAQVKLAHHRLWDFFSFGAFADDSERRDDLGPHALRRARERLGVAFAPGDTWVIGDTPHDIACARAFGAKSLAVATGGHTVADLSAHRPTALLPDLADADAFWHALLLLE